MPVNIDKKKDSVYIYYSPATDITGKKLAEALNAEHGSSLPTKKFDFVIGWGAKTKDPVSLGAAKALNHPDAIATNRNKFTALKLMKDGGVSVAPFIDAVQVTQIGKAGCDVKLPVIGRSKYHQGGKGFWSCPTMTQVSAAIEEGAQYLQNLIEIKDEYRLHTFGDKVIHAVKKVKRTAEETEEAFIRQEIEKQRGIAAKKGTAFDEATALAIITQQAKMFAQNGANMLVRSNRLGWKFAKMKTCPEALAAEAIKALKAIGLTFGAVDCCVDAAGKPYIIEVNSGPGLEETTFDVWVDAFKKQIAALNPKAAVQQPEKVTKATAGAPTAGMTAAVSASARKASLIEKAKLMQEMLTVADDNEVSAIDSVFKKMFG